MSLKETPIFDFGLSTKAILYTVPRIKEVMTEQLANKMLNDFGYPQRISFQIDDSRNLNFYLTFKGRYV